MNFIVCFLVALYFSDSQAGGGGKGSKHDILKIHVPEIIKHQYHTHYVFIHSHEPKKAPKKKEVKHHHKHIHIPSHGHHHWFTSHAHKHTTKHGHSTGKPVTEVHKVKKPQVEHKHKAPKPHVTHKHKTKVPVKSHDQPVYPFTHEDVRYTSVPAIHGYQVNEDFGPEAEINEYDSDDYSIPGQSSGYQSDGNYQSGLHYSQGGGSTAYQAGRPLHTQYYGNPQGHSSGQYVAPGLSSYDISPYHAVQSAQNQYQVPGRESDYSGSSAEEPSYNIDDAIQDEGFRGDYDFDYEPHFDGDFQQVYNGVSQHINHASDDFGENVPGYSHQHKRYLKNVKRGAVSTTAYDGRSHKVSAKITPAKQTKYKQSFSHVGRFV